MNDLVVLDSSVLVDHLRTKCHAERIESLAGVIRYSVVVMAELWRGARTEEEKSLLLHLERSGPLLTPTREDWIESGRLLADLRKRLGFEPAKLRDLHFDVLIALTARAHGARLITSNRTDFDLIRKYVEFKLEAW